VIAVLQVDGTSRELLKRMLAAGEMPALSALMTDGTRHELASPGLHFPAGAFVTLYSGLEEGDHGHVYPFQWQPSRQRVMPATDFGAPDPVWRLLARAGKRSVVVDPYEVVEADEAGPIVSGWQFAERTVLPRWSRPEKLWGALARDLGRPPQAHEVFGRKTFGDLVSMRDSLVAASERIAPAVERLLREGTPDLLWVGFIGAHIGGHQLLEQTNLDTEGLSAAEREELEDGLPAIYRALDRAVGGVASQLPADAEVMVVSTVGMEPNTSRADLMPAMLDAVLSGRAPEQSAGGIWRIRSMLPAGLRGRVSRMLPTEAALRLTARLETPSVDWARTSAFAHPADNQGYVRLNLRGREAQGSVEPGEADELCERIATGLMGFRDPDGNPSVESVDRTAGLYSGERADLLPDLVVRWARRPANSVTHVTSPELGEITRIGVGSGRSGNHPVDDCWVHLAAGAAAHRQPSRPPRLTDVAATVMGLAGVDSGLPGEPLLER
jgi:predicted AlkP superfamily phosphohydrolase/phosphomutase